MLAVFDFLVCATAIFAATRPHRVSATTLIAQVGLLSVAFAALVGTVRYAGYSELTAAHQFASKIAAVVGVPFAAVGFLTLSRRMAVSMAVVIAATIAVAGFLFFRSPTYALAIGIVAQVIWLVGGWLNRHAAPRLFLRALIAVVLTSVAGLLFAGQGEWYGIQKENIFHGLLALSLLQQGLILKAVDD